MHGSWLNILSQIKFIINAFTENAKTDKMFLDAWYWSICWIQYLTNSIMVTNYFTTMTLFIFLPSHDSAAVVMAMVIALHLHSLGDGIVFAAASMIELHLWHPS